MARRHECLGYCTSTRQAQPNITRGVASQPQTPLCWISVDAWSTNSRGSHIPAFVRRIGFPVAVLLPFFLVACGEGLAFAVAENPKPDPVVAPTVDCSRPYCEVIEVKLSDFKIMPSRMAASAPRVRFLIKNEGMFTHSLELMLDRDLFSSPKIGPGQTGFFDVDVRPGTHELTCPITGHAVRGQRATIVVRGANGY